MIRIHKTYSEIINAVTHTAPHHADEVFATAMLSILFPVELLRTRDQNIIEHTKAFIYDVGGEFNIKKRHFDHHQKDFFEVRPDGIIYSSAGLIWREYGVEIIKKIDESNEINNVIAEKIALQVDEELIKGIDAKDNGQSENSASMSVSSIIGLFNPLWNENENPDIGFLKACELAKDILIREIKTAISFALGRRSVEEAINLSSGTILVMERFVSGWLKTVLESENKKANQLLYGVFPAIDGNWNIQAIPPDNSNMMLQRKSFPPEWCGLSTAELVKNSGVETAIFCHAAGFFAVTGSKKDAVKMAEIASAQISK